MPKPTLKTISKLSGLAVPTVSRALSDAPDISTKTKEKIRKIAADIGYVPNRAGVRLRTGRTNVISLVISTEDEIMNMTARLTASIANGLRGTPYHLNMTHFFTGDDPMVPIRYIVETGSADAVIFNAVQPNDPRVKYLVAKGFPFAMHGRSQLSERQANFDYDNDAFARLAVETLAGRDRRHLLLIPPPISQFYSQEIVKGAKAACLDHKVDLVIAQGVTSDSTIEDVLEFTASILVTNPNIDGIVTAAPNAAMAATAGLEKAGRVIGHDIDLVAKDAITFLKLFRNEMIIIREDVALAGEFLAKSAIHAIRAPSEPRMRHLDIPSQIL
ncbi:MAG: LacI family transcriptional regulator [Planktomarina sp.]